MKSHAFGPQQTLGHIDLQMTKRYVYLVDADLGDIHSKAAPPYALLPKKGGPRVKKVR